MIVNRLSEIMGKKRLKISDVVKMTNLARSTVADLYNDKVKRIDFNTLERLCEALECEVQDIIVYRKGGNNNEV